MKQHMMKNTAVTMSWTVCLFSQWIGHSNQEAKRSYILSDLWSCVPHDMVCEVLKEVMKQHMMKNTAVTMSWTVCLFSQWIDHSNQEAKRSYILSDLWSGVPHDMVCEVLSLFCTEVRQKNGERYTPKSLLQLLSILAEIRS